MNTIKGIAGTLFLLALVSQGPAFTQNTSAAGGAPAQEMLGVMDIQVKPGMGLEWENYLKKDLLPALRKGGMKEINSIRTNEFGVSDAYAMWWPIKSLAEFDTPGPFERALGPDGLVILLSNIQRCIAGARTYVLVTHPGLEIAPKPEYSYKLAVIVSVAVAPGRTDEYEKNAKDMISVLSRTNVKAVHIGRVGFGGNPNEYHILAAFDSFADIERFLPAFAKAASEAKVSPGAGIVMQSEMQIYKFLPDLSIQPSAQ